MNAKLIILCLLHVLKASGMLSESAFCEEEPNPQTLKNKYNFFKSFNLKELPLLGAGASGFVYKVELPSKKGSYAALKTGTDFTSSYKNEICIYLLTKNLPHIVQMIDYHFQLSENKKTAEYFILLELGDKSLQDELKNPTEITQTYEGVIKMFKEVIIGVKELHKLGILYRDLNPKNIIFFKDIAKLTDFGVSGIASKVKHKNQQLSNSDSTNFNLKKYVGIEIQKDPLTLDIEKIGIMMYRVLFGYSLFAKKYNRYVLPKGTDFVFAKFMISAMTSVEKEQATLDSLDALLTEAQTQKTYLRLSKNVEIDPKEFAPDFEKYLEKAENFEDLKVLNKALIGEFKKHSESNNEQNVSNSPHKKLLRRLTKNENEAVVLKDVGLEIDDETGKKVEVGNESGQIIQNGVPQFDQAREKNGENKNPSIAPENTQESSKMMVNKTFENIMLGIGFCLALSLGILLGSCMLFKNKMPCFKRAKEEQVVVKSEGTKNSTNK